MQQVPMTEHAPGEAFTWRAIYHSGEIVSEFEESRDGSIPQLGRGWAEVAAEQVRVVTLENPFLTPYFTQQVVIPEGARPVFFRRRRIEVNPASGESTPMPCIHCIGWVHEGGATDGLGCYLFVFDDGSSILTSDLNGI
jgi:hypothetical protein